MNSELKSTRLWHSLPREGKALLAVVVIEFIGTGLVLPFNVVYLHEVRLFSLATTGALLAIPAISSLLLVGPAGRFIDTIGPRRVLIVASAAAPIGQLLVASAHTALVAAIGLAVSGFSLGVAHPASVSMMATIVPSELRPRYWGVQFVLLNLGIGLGGMLGGLFVSIDSPRTFVTIYIVDAISFLPALFLILWPLRHIGNRVERPDDEPAGSYLNVLRRPAVVSLSLVTFLAAFVGYGQLNSGLPAYARAVSEVSTRGLGFAFAANTVVIVALQLVVLKYTEGRRRTRVTAAMGLTWAVAWGLLGASGIIPGTWGATLLVAACTSVFALGETMLQPTIPSIVNDLAPDHLRGRYNALSVMCIQSASAVGPFAAGVLLGAGRHTIYLWLLIFGSLATGGLMVWLVEPRLPAGTNGEVSPSPAPEPATSL